MVSLFVCLLAAPPDFSAHQALRVIVHGRPDDVLRDDSPQLEDLVNADGVAAKIGAILAIEHVPERSELVKALAQDQGDVLISPVIAGTTLPFGMKESVPVRSSDVVVVVKKGAPRPQTKDALSVARVQSDRFDAVLKKVAQEIGRPLPSERIAALDDLDAISRVGLGEIESCVALADDVRAHKALKDDVEVALVLARVPLVWSVKKDQPKLLEAVNHYFSEIALTQHRRVEQGGDLPDMKRRKVLRVAMQNNPVSYFVHRGQEMGFQFELAQVLAERLGVRLEVVVPDKPDAIAALLESGRADLAVSSTHADPKIAYSQPYMFASQVLVQRASEPAVTDKKQLAGRKISVRKSSAYWPVLAGAKAGFELLAADERLETEDLIDAVAKGTIDLTVSNSSLFDVERQLRDDVQSSLVFAEAQPLVYAARPSSKALLAEVNAFIKQEYKGKTYNTLFTKYFRSERRVKEQQAGAASGISPYDELAKKYAAQYGLDWRFVIAQMYTESHFDPQAKSWVGAVGLMQVMPKTAASLGFSRLAQPEEQVHAGVRYMSDLLKRIDPGMDLRQRLRFALAAYNAGLGHVMDARELAKERGLDASRWFDHVEQAMLLLEKKEFAERARHGYCRGRDVVRYVSQIQSKYDAYVVLAP
jgi:membrane-bound lytic murein transglycosylase F